MKPPAWYVPGRCEIVDADNPKDARVYVGLTPREAIIAAYAQVVRNDWNTWDYARRYADQVEAGKYGWWAGSRRFWTYDPELASITRKETEQ